MQPATAQSGRARLNPSERRFSPVLRVLAVFGGLAAAGAMLVFGGLYALFSTCADYDGANNVCGGLAPLVEPLELLAVFGGAAAALAGGIGTAADGRARWIVGGLAATTGLALLLCVLVGVQQPAMT